MTGLAGGASDSFRALLGMPALAADAADARKLLAEPDAAVKALLREARALHDLR